MSAAPLAQTLRVVLHCAEIVALVSPAARAELLRHAATLRLAGEPAEEFAAPDIPGGSREAPAHQGGLPPVAGEDHDATGPVNACPGAASDDAAGTEDKAADPAPAAPPQRAAARRVPEPSVAARELVEVAAEQLVAPANLATITGWGRANGVEIDRFWSPDLTVERVNARRRALGLTPFRLVKLRAALAFREGVAVTWRAEREGGS